MPPLELHDNDHHSSVDMQPRSRRDGTDLSEKRVARKYKKAPGAPKRFRSGKKETIRQGSPQTIIRPTKQENRI